jgi:hypothetical protein
LAHTGSREGLERCYSPALEHLVRKDHQVAILDREMALVVRCLGIGQIPCSLTEDCQSLSPGDRRR